MVRACRIAFGLHPWFALAGTRREDWLVALPEREHVVLDRRGLPTGERRHEGAECAPLGMCVFDDAYAGLAPGAAFAATGGGRRVTVTLVEGYPCAQVFAPAAEDVVCFEPMTAPPNALVTGDGLRLADMPFTARVLIAIEPAADTNLDPRIICSPWIKNPPAKTRRDDARITRPDAIRARAIGPRAPRGAG